MSDLDRVRPADFPNRRGCSRFHIQPPRPVTRLVNIQGMSVQRFGVSFDQELAAQVQAAARAAGQPVSTWLAEAARRRLARDGLLAVVADWEAEHGPLSEEELANARRELGLAGRRRRSA